MKILNRFFINNIFLLFLIVINFSCKVTPPSFPKNEQQARQAPDWITRGIIYELQPRAFTQEGTLNAAKIRLSKVADVGANIIYLNPVFLADDDMDQAFWSPRQKASCMNNPRNPYRMKDYYHVDPEYGTDNDLKDFINEAHRLKMRVMLDMVYLHCGPTAVFIKDYPNFIKHDEDGKAVNAAWSFPALNYTNPELREYLWKNMEYWVNDFDADGFRCDVADGIPLDFWETARKRLETIRPDIGMLSEGQNRVEDQITAFDINDSDTWLSGIVPIYRDGKPASLLRETVERLEAIFPRGARFTRFIDNHDIANDAWHNGIEKEWGTKGVNTALALIFTLDGVPFLYNGQEIADTTRHSIFGRLPINWADANIPVGITRFALCKNLSQMRLTEQSLTEGRLEWLDNDAPNEVISYKRTLNGEQILIVVNISERPIKAKIAGMDRRERNSFNILLSEGIQGDVKKCFDFQGFGFWIGKIDHEN
jgi:cyclomaltodextrinase / maltogenic alpha-amylase / neopullulanase